MSWQKTADAVVIGGGMMGMATAYYLAKLGMKDVVLLEKNTVASGVTGRRAAAFRSDMGRRIEHYLRKACIDKYEKTLKSLAWILGFYQNGYLFIAYSDEQVKTQKVHQNFAEFTLSPVKDA